MKQQDLASKRRQSINRVSIAFLLPTCFFLVLFIFRSVVYTFNISTLDWNGVTAEGTFIGLENWKVLAQDAKFWGAVKNNVIMVISCIAIQMPIAMLLAFLIDGLRRGARLVKAAYFLPLLMSSVAIGFLFRQLFEVKYGLAGVLMRLFMDKPFNLLSSGSTALVAVIIVISWQYVPFYMLYYYAGLTTISTDIYEAAVIDGATRVQYIFRVAIPMMSDTIKSAVIMCMVGSLKYFDLIYVMTEGGPSGKTELMATYMYKNAFTSMKMGYGSTIASAMFLIITIISLLSFKAMYLKGED